MGTLIIYSRTLLKVGKEWRVIGNLTEKTVCGSVEGLAKKIKHMNDYVENAAHCVQVHHGEDKGRPYYKINIKTPELRVYHQVNWYPSNG